jgi:hypothetical protein
MRFAIRDLLWLTVVVALAVGWWIDRSGLSASASRMEDAAHEVASDWANDVGHAVRYQMPDGKWTAGGSIP